MHCPCMGGRMRLSWALSLSICAFLACAEKPAETRAAQVSALRFVGRFLEPIRVVPPPPDLAQDKLELGRRLFHESRLSGDGSVSCASCHGLAMAGVDRLPLSLGAGGVKGLRNAPTVFNVALNGRLFWDGRARSLEEQIDGPLLDAREMASSWALVLERLGGEHTYRQAFQSAYGRPVDAAAVRDALSTFERSLMTVGAPFDRYLGGDEAAIGDEAKAGYRLFKNYGCSACHQGANVGGNMFARLGEAVAGPRPEDASTRLRVPPLRLVALTAPYFHDGSVEVLDEAIRIMGERQLGRRIAPEERQQIAAFLATLAPPELTAEIGR